MTIYYEFEYKSIKEDFSYEVPFEKQIEAIRKYFDNQLVTLDGTDNDIWNALVDLDCIDTILDTMEDWLYEQCKEMAYEDYQDYVDWYYDDELEDK